MAKLQPRESEFAMNGDGACGIVPNVGGVRDNRADEVPQAYKGSSAGDGSYPTPAAADDDDLLVPRTPSNKGKERK